MSARTGGEAETPRGRDVALAKEAALSSETGNARAQKEQQGSSEDNVTLQKAQSRDPDKSNARDREGRKGGDNAKNL